MESIKQEIISCIYENGEGLITGPVLQEVLLDMVNDVNSKDSALSSSIAETIADIPILDPDEYATTASVNELSESLNERIDNIITGSGVDLSGYLTTASYQIDSASFDERINSIPIPDLSEYATTESLNQVSESLAQEIADIDIPDISGLATTSSVEELSSSLNERIDNIPQVDLSGYATTESVNEATQSVKEWVEAKHYLTTASLSGSVTEETVGFMINDATASIKDWVEDQNYATTQSVTDLSSSIAETISEITGSDLSGYLTTASYLVDSASFDERIDSIDIPDVSIYATTESLNNLSESIAETYATEEFVSSSIADIEIPSIEGLATTESVNQLSESVAQTIADLPQVDLSGYATTSSVNTLVNETSESVKSWVEEQGYLTEHQDISGLATTSSVNELSESLNQRIDDIDIPDVSIYATTASVNELSESLNSVSSSFDERINAITGSDLSGYATTESLNQLSESVAQDIADINIPDVSIYATTSSVSELSSSIAQTIEGLDIPDTSEFLTTASYLVDSASFDQRIESIPQVDLSGYATTESVNQLSSSIAQDFDNLDIPDVSGFATTSSVNNLSASFDQRINDITGSGADLSGYALTASLVGYSDNQDITDLQISTVPNYYGEITESVNLGFSTLPEDGQMISIDVLNSGASASLVNIPDTLDSLTCVVNGVEGSGSCSIPAGEHGDIVVTRKDDVLYFRTSIDVSNISVDLSGYATTASLQNYVPNSATESIMTTTLEETLDRISNSECNPDNPVLKALTQNGCNPIEVHPYFYHNGGEGDEYVYESTEPWNEGDEFYGWIPTTLADLNGAVKSSNEIWADDETPNPDIRFRVSFFGVDGSPEGQYTHARLKIVPEYVEEEGEETAIPRTVTFNYQWDYPVEGFPVELEVWNEDENVVASFEIPESINDGEKGIIYNGTLLTSSLTFEIDPRTAKFFTLREWGDNIYIDTLSGYASQGDLNDLSGSLNQRIENIITGSGADLSGYATTASVNQLSESIAQDISSINIPDVSIYATTSSVNQLSESLSSVSASFDTRINSITGSGGDGIWRRGTGTGSAILGESANIENFGSYSIVLQDGKIQTGSGCIVGGAESIANGYHAIAVGTRAYASGSSAVAIGQSVSASAQDSVALGEYTKAKNKREVAIGWANSTSSMAAPNPNYFNQIFSVGAGYWNGSGEIKRRNAMCIHRNDIATEDAPTVYIYGIGGYDGTNPTSGSNDIASYLSSSLGNVEAALQALR